MTTTTGTLSIGGTASGTISLSGDKTLYSLSLAAGRNYEFDVSNVASFVSPSSLGETLLDPNGLIVKGGSGTKVISITPTVSGNYTLSVAAGNSSSGGFVVTSSPFDDYTGDMSSTGRLANGTTISGNLEGVSDTDVFAVQTVAGLHYQFTLTPVATSTASYLGEVLIGSNGVILVGGYGYLSTQNISITSATTGTEYISVSASSGSGGYTLSASALDDYASDASTTGRLTVGGTTSGTIEAIGDTDAFAVSLVAGQSYKFSLTPAANSAASYLGETLIAPDGTKLVGGLGYLAVKTISITAATTGTYLLSINNSSGSGAYTITTTGSPSNNSTTSVPVYRFFDSNTGTQFLTSSTTERDTVINTRHDLISEGVGLQAAAANDPNASAVYRFFDTHYGTHFFTSSANERDTIQATRADLTYEGIGFNEYASQQPGSTAVYRFFDSNRGTHFFTSSANERATILSTRADLIAEGISFYAPTT